MRIVCDIDTVLNELNAYHKETIARSKFMLGEFAYKVTWAASKETPVGDQARIDLGFGEYWHYYQIRKAEYGIDDEAGFHAGAWKFSRTPNFQFDPTIYTDDEAAGRVRQDFKGEFAPNRRIFYIGARGPGYAALEDGYSMKAPIGITVPTMQLIQDVISVDLAADFKAMQ